MKGTMKNVQDSDTFIVITLTGIQVYLAVGVVSESFVSFVKHYTAHLVRQTRPPGDVILHHLRSQEEHSLCGPLRVALFRRQVSCRHTMDDIIMEDICTMRCGLGISSVGEERGRGRERERGRGTGRWTQFNRRREGEIEGESLAGGRER